MQPARGQPSSLHEAPVLAADVIHQHGEDNGAHFADDNRQFQEMTEPINEHQRQEKRTHVQQNEPVQFPPPKSTSALKREISVPHKAVHRPAAVRDDVRQQVVAVQPIVKEDEQEQVDDRIRRADSPEFQQLDGGERRACAARLLIHNWPSCS